jgi:hypothetical protein
MSAEFSVTIGQKTYRYGKEPSESFDVSVIGLRHQVRTQFLFKSGRHHVGTMNVDPKIARWLAHALLSAVEGSPDTRINKLCVRAGRITARVKRENL